MIDPARKTEQLYVPEITTRSPAVLPRPELPIAPLIDEVKDPGDGNGDEAFIDDVLSKLDKLPNDEAKENYKLFFNFLKDALGDLRVSGVSPETLKDKLENLIESVPPNTGTRA